MNKRYLQCFFTMQTESEAVELTTEMVQKHQIVVSYHFSDTSTYYRRKGRVLKDNNSHLVLIKTKERIFQDQVVTSISNAGGEDLFSLPIVDCIEDYEKWMDDEIQE